ncbi:MAG TPA: CHAT domain-containing tetratricopeptide repeat protein [Bryobacteraceae bacterium]|nr:CHAT domain-containing tetratricopeptide repeat protein [Bryobacteraceae bacterium]
MQRLLRGAALLALPVILWAQPAGSGELQQLQNRAGQLFAQGNYREAAPLAEQVVTLTEQASGKDSAPVAEALINLGAVYRELGKTDRAETALTHALQIDTRMLGPESEEVARACNILGLVYRDREDFIRAEPLLGRSLAIREKILPAGSSSIILSMENLGDTYRGLGRYLDGELLLKKALELREAKSGTSDRSLIWPLNNLATLYEDMNNAGAASDFLERALAIAKKPGNADELQLATLYSNLGHQDLVRGRDAEARGHLDSALQVVRRLEPDSLKLASVLSNTALVKKHAGDYTGATRDFAEAVAIREARQPGSALLADSLENLALMSWLAGDAKAALQAFTKATEIREIETPKTLAMGSPEQKAEFLKRQVDTLDSILTLQMGALPDSPEAAQLALRSVLFRKGLLLDTLANESAVLKDWPPDDRPLANQLRRLRSQTSTFWFSQRQSKEAWLHFEVSREMERQLSGTLRSRNPEVHVVTPVPRLAAVLAALPIGSVLADWVRVRPTGPNGAASKPRYFCYAIAQDGRVLAVDNGPAEEIEQQVSEFRSAITSNAAPDKIQLLGRGLEKRLLEPLYPLIAKQTELILSPDGELTLLPFAALSDADGKYAGERWSLSYVTSGRDLVRVPSHVASRQNDVVVADPAFGAAAPDANSGAGSLAGMFGDLPAALEEGKAVHELLPQSTLLAGSDATEEAVKSLHGPRILHLATHGFFLNSDGVSTISQSRGVKLAPLERNYKYIDDPMLKSGIALAGANTGGSPQENGVLTATEASDLDLEGTDLVVLSACDTGVGEPVIADGVYGLRRAFAIAGARAQVLSLWKVNDEATEELMKSFYGELAGGAPKDVALQRAQLRLLTDGKHGHPYYWAAFALSGDRSPLPGAIRKLETPPLQESPSPAAPSREELMQAREDLAKLNSRASVIHDILERLKQSQQAMGLGPSAKFTQPESLMDSNLHSAREALDHGDLAVGKEAADKAERQIEILERLLNL